MTFEATFAASQAAAALDGMEDRTASGRAARSAIESIVASGALGDDRLLHVHATTSERLVAILVQVVNRPEDAR